MAALIREAKSALLRSTVAMSAWEQLGPHRYRFDGNVMHWEPHGIIQPAHADRFSRLLVGLYRQNGEAYCLSDASDAVPLSADARRAYVDVLKEARPQVVMAVFGASALMQISGRLVNGAARLLTGLEVNLRYFADRAQAEAYLAEKQRLFVRPSTP